MTLMLFLRDYVFYPLSNARSAAALSLVQLFSAMLLTMALCGLWHGAELDLRAVGRCCTAARWWLCRCGAAMARDCRHCSAGR